MKDPALVYQLQLEHHQLQLKELLKKRNRLGWIRFIVFILMIIVSYQVFISFGIWGLLPTVAGIGMLLYLVSVDVNNNQKINNTRTLITINEEELRFLSHDFHHHYDGNKYTPALHDYANDLDLFGKASIFQWMNRCYTEQGRDLLAHDLLHPASMAFINKRHEAIKELAPETEWRQQLQSFAMQTTVTKKTETKTVQWLSEEESHFKSSNWKIVVSAYSVITISITLAAIVGFIPGGIYSFLYGLFLTTSIILSRNTVKPYILLSGIVKEVATLQQLVSWIEKPRFASAWMQQLQHQSAQHQIRASEEIRDLKSILDRFDLRLNIAGLLFFNAFFLWDVRQMIALNEWRRKNKHHVSGWFEMIAETEILNSLASIHFNQPSWCFPEIVDEHFVFRTTSLGHPLIPAASRVDNNFDLEGLAKIGLITGSNMAGKSTFLRSLGVNTVLAQMGSPVCALSMTLSPVHLMSSMRIADNLAENTSTFYAELKKLKTIIEAVNRQEKVFILLDEILRGTNSYDRHTGSAALIAQLVRKKAVAVIATHDVELAKLEATFRGSVINYHFDVQVEGEELFFDYKLKNDVCTSLNASILMKKIGIELEEQTNREHGTEELQM